MIDGYKVDYRKIDPELAGALADACDLHAPSSKVFIETEHPPRDEEAAVLEAVGVSGSLQGRLIFTAELSPAQVARLSEEPWVRFLTLSRKLRQLGS